MKKIILKTALITLGITLLLAISVFGLVSAFAPAAMMRLTASLGMTSVSGDYAYEEYKRSGDLSYLARAFEIAAEKSDDRTAEERFELLYGEEGSEARAAFGEYCAAYTYEPVEDVPAIDYRAFICGQAACVKYRLSESAEEKEAVWAFAERETDAAFPSGNPVVALSVEAVSVRDASFCRTLLAKLAASRFDKEARDYKAIVKLLEGNANE